MTRPFQQLRVHDDVPMLPSGYVGMVDMVMAKNEEFPRSASEELRRCELGPFSEGAQPAQERKHEPTAEWRAGWRGLPAWLRVALASTAFLGVVTVGAQLLGESSASFVPGLLWNAWILAAFVAVFRVENRLSARGTNPVLGWSLALGLLVVLGAASERVLALFA